MIPRSSRGAAGVAVGGVLLLTFLFLSFRTPYESPTTQVDFGKPNTPVQPQPPAPEASSTTPIKFYPSSEYPTDLYPPGTPKPPGSNYTTTLVVARLEKEDVSWIEEADLGVKPAIYVTDKPALSPGFQVPLNKGHEAMVYLTYIIDHYDELSDTTIFVHAHRTTWHNNDLLDSHMDEHIRHLSHEHVARVGYFNLRCHHEPGCPDWLHLDRPDDELDTYRKMEEKTFSLTVWQELHPGVPPPLAISQPCCAQFALSRDRIHRNSKQEYIRYRDWIMNTSLEDTFSGRVMEYTWQFLFSGLPELCPEMNVCYCDGYGICFGGPEQFKTYFDIRDEMRKLWSTAEIMGKNPSLEAEVREMRDKAQGIERQMEEIKRQAFERGKDPKSRAEECGRPWKEGDGF